MTDHPTPITDEELSAHLDGEGAPDLAARITDDADAQHRLSALSGAARALGDATVPPLEPSVVDDLVARALAAGDGAAASAVPPAPITPMAGAGVHEATQREVVVDPIPLVAPRSRPVPPTWMVAAAVALVVALGVGLVISGRNDRPSEQAATSATTTAPSAKSGTASADTDDRSSGAPADNAESGTPKPPGHGGAAPDAVPSSTIPGRASEAYTTITPVELGPFPSADALRATLAPGFPAPSAGSTAADAPTPAALQRCGTQVAVTLDLELDPIHLGFGTVDGRSVLVYEFPSTSYTDERPTTLVAAVGAGACEPVLTFQR